MTAGVIRQRIYQIWIAACIVAMASACDNADDFYIESLDVALSSWDSVRVEATFASDPGFGAGARVYPDVVTYTIFNSSYDTLFVGDSSAIQISDKDLGDQERLLIEVCGFFEKRSACDQKTYTTSPKRVQAEYSVEFPADSSAYNRGRVRASVTIERQRFGEETWERIRPSSRKELFVIAYVVENKAASVRIPIGRSNNRFVLSRYAGYRDFRFNIQSAIMDADSAAIQFDLYARLSRNPTLVATEQIVLRNKTERERMSEVSLLVERTGSQILRSVSGIFGVRRAYVFINEWSYEALDKAYKAEFELHWQDSFRGEWSDMTGELYVRSDGTLGTFSMIRASERAERRWNSRVGEQSLDLDPLFPELVIDPPEEELTDIDPDTERRRQ